MKYNIIFAIIFFSLFIIGCTQETTNIDAKTEASPEWEEKESISNYEDIIKECDSLCNSDADSYCKKERTVIVEDKEMVGTCRSFSKKGNIEGFNRCQGFCKSYGKI